MTEGHPPEPAAPSAPEPGSSPPPPGSSPPEPGSSPPQPAPAPAARRSLVERLVAAGLVLALATVAGYQSWRLEQLSTDLADTVERLDQLVRDQRTGGERLDALAERTGALERAAGEEFDPEAIADAVLPSVFKVVAGDFSGTAFAVNGPADEGGTDLFTNYHVVEQVWLDGGREVFLERSDQRYPAEIVDVDRSADVAWLHTDSVFDGLDVSRQQVRTGQPIVSVGAPLGLGDTLTTGVVSNTGRTLPDGSGPWIQFDAAVQPGNSGGPVIDAARRVVGIATRKATDVDGIGFAVPIADACDVFRICGR